jgi:hypothetical protein
MSKKVWTSHGGGLFLENKQTNLIQKLEVGVYELSESPFGFYLQPISENFDFSYKIYGLETSLINRVLKYYFSTESGNLGVLLNGIKGTGKTVTSKIICNKLNLPIILVPKEMERAESFINSIPQDIVVFIDEYEKIYKESKSLLTIMDGALNSDFRRIFIMTTNRLNIDENLLDRPSRVRYLQTFGNLMPNVVEEIVDDILKYKEYKQDCITYISTLEIITVDIVKAVINEVNIHNESPTVFKNVFNVSIKKGKYKIFMLDETHNAELICKGVKISHKTPFGERHIGQSFYVDGDYIGEIVDVVDFATVKVKVVDKELEKEEDVKKEKKPTNRKKVVIDLSSGELLNGPKNNEKDSKEKEFKFPHGKIVTLNILEDYSYNDTYRYGGPQVRDDYYW